MMCAVLLLSPLACTPKPPKQEVKNTLTVVISADPVNLDANHSDSQTHYQVTRQIYETLFVYDQDYNIAPWLCESYNYEDDVTIILKLRKGVKFHNGDELKASDVMFTFQRIVDDHLSGLIEVATLDLPKCEIIDTHTLKLVTKGPVATQIPLLENPAASIISERAYRAANGDWLKGAAVGTGPFQFVSYAAGDQIVMKAFKDYWRPGEPGVENLVMRFVRDSSSRSIEAETAGAADIVYDIGSKDLARIRAAKGVSIIDDLGTNTSYLLFNTARAPLNNIKVREAIWYGVDARTAVNLAYGDFGAFAEAWVCPGIGGYDPTQKDKYLIERDVAKAKTLLAQAGFPNGFSLKIAVPNNNQERMDMAEVFQAQLAEIGIDVKVDTMESSAWISHILAGKHDLTIYGMSASDFEADRALAQYMPLHVNHNLCAYKNKEFQDLFTTAVVTLDKDARFQMYRDASNLLLRDFVTLPLWHKALNAAVKDHVTGFRITRSYEHHYLQYVKFRPN